MAKTQYYMKQIYLKGTICACKLSVKGTMTMTASRLVITFFRLEVHTTGHNATNISELKACKFYANFVQLYPCISGPYS